MTRRPAASGSYPMAQRLGPRLDVMEAVEDTAAVGVADYSSFGELQRGGLGWENTVYDGELGVLPVYLVAPVLPPASTRWPG